MNGFKEGLDNLNLKVSKLDSSQSDLLENFAQLDSKVAQDIVAVKTDIVAVRSNVAAVKSEVNNMSAHFQSIGTAIFHAELSIGGILCDLDETLMDISRKVFTALDLC